MNHWPVQEAKSRFSELIDQSLAAGAQVITRHGRATAVVLPYAQWLAYTAKHQRDLKSVLLDASTPRLDIAIPARGSMQFRKLTPDVLA